MDAGRCVRSSRTHPRSSGKSACKHDVQARREFNETLHCAHCQTLSTICTNSEFTACKLSLVHVTTWFLYLETQRQIIPAQWSDTVLSQRY